MSSVVDPDVRLTLTLPVSSADLPIERGVALLVGADQIAVFRLANNEVLAIDHVDPFTGTSTLARGLLGSVGDRLYVASPLHKKRFDLRTGECLDDSEVRVRSWSVSEGETLRTSETNAF